MTDTLHPVRGSRRPLRAAGAGLVVFLVALVLPWTAVPAQAAGAPPLPIANPASVEGALTDLGSAIKIGGTELTGVVLAGLGAYQGTCYVQGLMFHDPDGCSQGLSNLVHLNFSGQGDARPSPPGWQYVSAGGAFVSTYDPAGSLYYSDSTKTAQSWGTLVTCSNSDGSRSTTMWYQLSHTTSTTRKQGGNFGCSDATTNVAPWDTPGKTAFGYPVAGGASASTVCGYACPVIQRAVFYVGLLDPSTGAVAADLPGPVSTAYAPDAQPWTVTYTLTCANGPQTASTSSTVHFIPTASGQSPDPQFAQTCSDLLPGSHVKSLGLSGGRDSVGNPEVNVVYPTFNPGALTAYPDCTTNAPAGGCWLDLQKDGKSCFSAGTSCVDWMTHTADWTLTCKWGAYNMPMSDCEDAYGQTDFSTVPRADPSPTTSPTTSPGADPTTNPSTDPSPSPSTGPSSGTNPSSGPVPDPSAPPDPSDSESSNCWGEGWSLNPVSWVFVPVKCALSWAFVPKTPFQERIDEIQGRFRDKFPFSMLAPLAGFAATIPASSCPDWHVTVQYPGRDATGGSTRTLQKNVVCDSSYTNAIRAGRPFFAAMMMVTALWPMIRGIIYGSFPIVKPVPTR